MEEILAQAKAENGPADLDEVQIEDLTAVLNVFRKLTRTGRARLINTIDTFFAIGLTQPVPLDPQSKGSSQPLAGVRPGQPTFSEERSISPKEFMLQKQPQTAIERVACLGYYLTHYRDTPHFKTLDISKLNTEAAQPKFSNAAMSVNDALKTGYLISVSKGNKQLSALAELFVQALPDRDAAKAAMAANRTRKRRRTTSQAAKKSEAGAQGDGE